MARRKTTRSRTCASHNQQKALTEVGREILQLWEQHGWTPDLQEVLEAYRAAMYHAGRGGRTIFLDLDVEELDQLMGMLFKVVDRGPVAEA